MKDLSSRVAILTGASRGLGVYIARALASEGVHLALAARNEERLNEVKAELEGLGVRVVAVATDICDLDQLRHLVARCESELGPPDLLINNAGIENAAAYDAIPLDEIDRFIDVNLRAPMRLTRLVLPGMVARNRGHIVNVCSLAGLAPAAFGEPYAATKHGMVGFTKSLRASEQAAGSQVSATAISPGFITDDGMYAQMQHEGAAQSPTLLGTSPPSAVANAVVRGIRNVLPHVVVNPGVPRLLFAVSLLFPRFAEWVSMRIGAHRVFQSLAERRGRGRKGV